MTTETVTGAVAKRETGPSAMIEQYRGDFATVLPSHIKSDTWVRLAVGALRRDANLRKAAERNPGSLMQALMECARLGHEPATESFYLIPIGGQVEGWEGYRGVVERMYRAGAVTSVKAEIVRERDHFVWHPKTMDKPDHEADWFGDRGEIIGAYSYAEMVGGATSRVVIIDAKYVAKVRAMSRGSDSSSSPWTKWPEAMWLKTALHRLEPFVPTSSEYIREQLRAVRDVANEKPPVADLSGAPEFPQDTELPADDVDVVDGEVVD